MTSTLSGDLEGWTIETYQVYITNGSLNACGWGESLDEAIADATAIALRNIEWAKTNPVTPRRSKVNLLAALGLDKPPPQLRRF